jgi:hypothetical protein
LSVDWELQKRVVDFRLIEVKHSSENIPERIASVVEEFGLIDKIFAVTQTMLLLMLRQWRL